MKLANRFTSCFCVKSVNILRYNRQQLAAFFKLRKLIMGVIRLCVGIAKMLPVKIIKFSRVFHKKCMAQNRFGRNFIIRHIYAVGRAEIGDVTFRRNTCASEKHNAAALSNQFVQL